MDWKIALALLAGCHETIPRAVVQARPGASTSTALGGAVLVLPTRCVTDLSPELCSPPTYDDKNVILEPSPPTYAPLIDPALRLKLEFAGYTLAEAATMQLTTRDRIDTNKSSAVEPVLTVADLSEPEIVDVARSLNLAAVVTSTLRVSAGPYAVKWFQLTVSLREVDHQQPAWSVTCTQLFLENRSTSKLLGNCVGNGVLAAYAPENLMGRPL